MTWTQWVSQRMRRIRVYYRWLRMWVFLVGRMPAVFKPCYNSHVPHQWNRGKEGYYCLVCKMRAPFIQRARW